MTGQLIVKSLGGRAYLFGNAARVIRRGGWMHVVSQRRGHWPMSFVEGAARVVSSSYPIDGYLRDAA